MRLNEKSVLQAVNRSIRTIAALTAFLTLWPAQAQPAEKSLKLEVAATVDGRSTEQGGIGTTEISIDLGTSQAGSKSFWLRNRGSSAIEGVTLQTDLAEGVQADLTVPGQKADDTFSATPLLRVDAAVSQVKQPGTYIGAIIARQGGRAAILGTLKIKRAGTLGIDGVGVSDTEISATTQRDVVSRHYLISSDDPEARTAKLEVDPFMGPNGAVDSAIHVDGSKSEVKAEGSGAARSPQVVALSIPPYGRVPLTISVDLPVKGEYTSALRVKLPDGRSAFSRTLRLTRTDDDAPVFTIHPLANKQIPDLFLWGETTATLDVTVTENNRAPLDIDEVLLLSLNLVKGEDKRQAGRGQMTVWLDGQQVDGFRVERNKTANPQIRIPGLSAVGQYSGTLRMSSGNLKPMDQPFTLFVSRSWWIAFLAIALGVAAAALLRWFGIKRQQYEVEFELEKVRSWLSDIEVGNKGLSQDLQPLLGNALSSLRRRIDQLVAMVRREPAAELGTALKELQKKVKGPLREWIERLRRADEQGLLDRLREDLAKIGAVFGQWGSDVAQFAEVEGQLARIDAVLAGGSVARLKEGINAQIQVVEGQQRELASKQAEVDAVVQKLRTALSLADSDAAAARIDFDQAWRDWIDLLVEEVVAGLPAEADPPLGFADQASWAAVRNQALSGFDEAREAVEPDESQDKYESALKELLKGQIEAFQSGLSDARNAVGDPRESETDKKKFLEALKKLEAQARDSRAQLVAGKLAEARRVYNQAVQEWSDAVSDFRRTGAGDTMSSTARPAALSTLETGQTLPSAGAGQLAQAGSKPPLGTPASLLGFRRRRWIANLGWTALATAVIGLVGLQVLYFDSAAWGSPKDIIIAVLWGLGLHTGSAAVTTAAVDRFTSVPGAS